MKRMNSGNLDWHESDLFQPVTPLPDRKANYRMALTWIAIAGMAGCWLIGECLFGFFFFFSPGWANGWPFGLSFQLVLSVAMTGYMSLMLMTAAAGVGAILEFIGALAGLREERQRQFYCWWLWIAAAVILCVSVLAFWRTYTWAWKEFPDGYVISQATPHPRSVTTGRVS